jgi:hypothetical protein
MAKLNCRQRNEHTLTALRAIATLRAPSQKFVYLRLVDHQTSSPGTISGRSLYLPEPVYEALRKVAFDERVKIHDDGSQIAPWRRLRESLRRPL